MIINKVAMKMMTKKNDTTMMSSSSSSSSSSLMMSTNNRKALVSGHRGGGGGKTLFMNMFGAVHLLPLAALVLLLLVVLPSNVNGHGMLTTPRSRNEVASDFGVDGTAAGSYKREYCSHCLNTNAGVCGISGYNNYESNLDSIGTPMVWNSQDTWTAGDIVTINSYLDTPHNGHMEIRACANGNASTMECFYTEGHELTFVEDLYYNMPADPNYPERGYYAGGQGMTQGDGSGTQNLKAHSMKFKLPLGVSGTQVMLHWRYITANKCSPPGYDTYFAGTNSQNLALPASYWTPGLSVCQPPYPDDGNREANFHPEQFFNCAEVTILPSQPTISPSPTTPPVPVATTAPVPVATPAPVPIGVGCCSNDYKNCNMEGWCSDSEGNCSGACSGYWLRNGSLENDWCTALWMSCSNDNDCCTPGVCSNNQCSKPPPTAPTPQAPVPAPTEPTTPTSPTPTPPTAPTDPTTPCCTIDFKNCSPTVEGWCSESEENCTGPCDKWWLPNGPLADCTARFDPCTQDSDCCSPGVCTSGQCRESASPVAPVTPTAPVPAPTAPVPVPTAPVPVPTAPIPAPTAPVPAPTAPVPAPTAPVPVPTAPEPTVTAPVPTVTAPVPVPVPAPTTPVSTLSCSSDHTMSSYDAFDQMFTTLSYNFVQGGESMTTILASGGAAGSGDVVSEGQAYGILASALTLASLDENDTNYVNVMDKFYKLFKGWKRMAEISSAPCQSPKYCNGGTIGCLPGWKHDADLSFEIGSGAAPDGDEDAILGMIIALKVVEDDTTLPSWYDTVKAWADASCTQFIKDSTVLSSSGNHRILKLGTCWGGWDSNGQNPSYHAPGHYRVFRDFQTSITNRSYSLPSLNGQNIEDAWNMLIDTSYKFLETTQCQTPDSGLVPNWALVEEINTNGIYKLVKKSGSFTGSGTPQYEYGSEASRTTWRIVVDALLYPTESATQSSNFLFGLKNKLVNEYNPSPVSDWDAFNEGALEACSPIVSNVFSAWRFNAFIYGPSLSSLATEIVPTITNQQNMIDSACDMVTNFSNSGNSYYPLSWQVLSTMTLNGNLANVAPLVNPNYDDSTSAPVVPTPTAPVPAPTAPVTTPTAPVSTPTSDNTVMCCANEGTGVCREPNTWCDESQTNCEGPCGGEYINPDNWVAPSKCCSDIGTGVCRSPNPWCDASQTNCEASCNGDYIDTPTSRRHRRQRALMRGGQNTTQK